MSIRSSGTHLSMRPFTNMRDNLPLEVDTSDSDDHHTLAIDAAYKLPAEIQQVQVDAYTLQVVQQLFPRGIEFLALVLRLAIVKQLSLSDLPEVTDVAVLSLQSIRVLSKRIGWSYDTTEKYIVLFCAVGLLLKQR